MSSPRADKFWDSSFHSLFVKLAETKINALGLLFDYEPHAGSFFITTPGGSFYATPFYDGSDFLEVSLVDAEGTEIGRGLSLAIEDFETPEELAVIYQRTVKTLAILKGRNSK